MIPFLFCSSKVSPTVSRNCGSIRTKLRITDANPHVITILLSQFESISICSTDQHSNSNHGCLDVVGTRQKKKTKKRSCTLLAYMWRYEFLKFVLAVHCTCNQFFKVENFLLQANYLEIREHTTSQLMVMICVSHQLSNKAFFDFVWSTCWRTVTFHFITDFFATHCISTIFLQLLAFRYSVLLVVTHCQNFK